MKSIIFQKKNYLLNTIIILLVFSIFTIATVTAQANNNGPQTTQGGSTGIEREGVYMGIEREGEDLPLPPPPPINTTYVDPYADKIRGNDYPLDAASYLTGLTLIASGVLSLFRGNKNKWLSIFLAAFYGTSIILLLFILKYQNVTNPSSTTRFVYFVICAVAGAAAGIFFICLWPAGRVLVGAFGGFSFAMICLSTRTDGLISKQFIRYIWIGIWTIFIASLASIKKYYQYVAIISTVMSGCYTLMLGTDVFVRAGILASFKTFWGFNQPENYLYIVDTNGVIILSTIGIVGGIFGIGAQLLELWMTQKGSNDDENNDDDRMSIPSTTEEKPTVTFTKKLKNTFKNFI
ncbi:hypothetical protein RirG_196530 [Rhizophagus irregularis DAOM 197198w]|uniref:TM7S3/TM198-like domain-containing protein n=2 Tax=Rhizophagus irregularis TaxID=588596 RepID=A0A015IWA7_RHIIW|nr:hypothetical protein RirG_196530 [Rhizophagus irregularis DAOM 197198w]